MAGLPAKFGLYNGFLGLLPYAFFGSSRHLVTGPTAVMSIIVYSILSSLPHLDGHKLDPSSANGTTGWANATSRDAENGLDWAQAAFMLSFLAGIIQVQCRGQGWAGLAAAVCVVPRYIASSSPFPATHTHACARACAVVIDCDIPTTTVHRSW